MMEQLAQILRLLGDETRLRILVLLSKHPLNVSELTSILGVAQSGVSRHLGHLRKLGLIPGAKGRGLDLLSTKRSGDWG